MHTENVAFLQNVPVERVPTNRFDLSHAIYDTCEFGYIVPLFWKFMYPGANWKVDPVLKMRFAPLNYPVETPITATIASFFVPFRLIDEKWEDFFTTGRLGKYKTPPPQFTLGQLPASLVNEGQLIDHLGLHPHTLKDLNLSVYPLRAYQKIYDDWFRDQNLIESLQYPDSEEDSDTFLTDKVVPTAEELGVNGIAKMRRVSYERDWLTASLPFTQRGDEITFGGVSGSMPVVYTPSLAPPYANQRWIEALGTAGGAGSFPLYFAPANPQSEGEIVANKNAPTVVPTNSKILELDPQGTLTVPLSDAVGVLTINELRRYAVLQQHMEMLARSGSRYTEVVLAEYGIASPDSRLQRAEYIAGTKIPVSVTEVLQTSNSSADVTPQGNFTGHAIAYGAGGRGSYFAREAGVWMTVMFVAPCINYSQGVRKEWLYDDPYDHIRPKFAHLGEQPVLNCEAYALEAYSETVNGVTTNYAAQTDPHGVFGYQPNYGEHRVVDPQVRGAWRTTLRDFILQRRFTSPPALNQQFIEVDHGELDGIFSVADSPQFNTDHLWYEVALNIMAKQPLPLFGEPGLTKI